MLTPARENVLRLVIHRQDIMRYLIVTVGSGGQRETFLCPAVIPQAIPHPTEPWLRMTVRSPYRKPGI